jgi:hypothetical protein
MLRSKRGAGDLPHDADLRPRVQTGDVVYLRANRRIALLLSDVDVPRVDDEILRTRGGEELHAAHVSASPPCNVRTPHGRVRMEAPFSIVLGG